MQDARRVIHYAVWINHNREVFLLKPTAYTVGKTGTDEEHSLAWEDVERWFFDSNNRSEIHFNFY